MCVQVPDKGLPGRCRLLCDACAILTLPVSSRNPVVASIYKVALCDRPSAAQDRGQTAVVRRLKFPAPGCFPLLSFRVACLSRSSETRCSKCAAARSLLYGVPAIRGALSTAIRPGRLPARTAARTAARGLARRRLPAGRAAAACGLARRALARHARAGLARLRQADRDRLLSAGHFATRAPALQRASLALMHRLLNFLGCTPAIFRHGHCSFRSIPVQQGRRHREPVTPPLPTLWIAHCLLSEPLPAWFTGAGFFIVINDARKELLFAFNAARAEQCSSWATRPRS